MKRNNKLEKYLIIIVVAYILGLITMPILNAMKKEKLENNIIYTITIDTEFINLRPEIDLGSDIIKKVYKGEQYKVVEYREGNVYNWYKVIYEDNKTGWVASGKEEPWIIVENEVK